MDLYTTVKILHIVTSTILFGTGIGIAFFMFCSRFTPHLQEKFYAARHTVLADFIFTAPAVLIQPAMGAWLMMQGGYDPMDLWLQASFALYVLAGLCWLPVWIQIQLKTMLRDALDHGTSLPPRYNRLFRIWWMLGIPAFISLIAIYSLMVVKPV